MNNIGINVQPLTVLPGEWAAIKRDYPAGILAIVDWPASLAALPIDANVTLWRFTQDPRGLPGWPIAQLARCRRAVFANEPDLEGWPVWYPSVCNAWKNAGGYVVRPARHIESAISTPVDPWIGGSYDVESWHDYASDFHNRYQISWWNLIHPFIGTEYGRPNDQRRCLQDLSDAGITETVYLFAWRWQGNASAGYDLAGVTMDQPTQVQPTDLYAGQWDATGKPRNPEAAIYKSWLENREAVGVPIAGEQPQANGTTVQFFSNAVAVWDGAKVEWR